MYNCQNHIHIWDILSAGEEVCLQYCRAGTQYTCVSRHRCSVRSSVHTVIFWFISFVWLRLQKLGLFLSLIIFIENMNTLIVFCLSYFSYGVFEL